MVAQIWYVRKLSTGPIVDGITWGIINSDSADSEAVVLAEAHTACIAAGHDIPASGYFTNADNALGAGFADTDEDAVFATERGFTEQFA
jgi:hypothetical protein